MTSDVPATDATPAAQVTFADLGLGPKLLAALTASGYTTPTPIQIQAIPPALAGRDVLGIAQTGTGKTAAFALPTIERLSKSRARPGIPRALILTPTRELAAQVADQVKKYAAEFKLKMVLLIGGVSFGDQEKGLQSADIIIATPGRLLDLFERQKVKLMGIQVMIVDEADRMLDMGFIPDVERIFKLTPFTRQTLFFSATMAKELQHLVDQFLQGAVRVEAAKQATTASTIDQRLVKVRDKTPGAKRDAMREAIDTLDVKNAIVFCNRKRDVDVVARSLAKAGYSASPIHGDLPQSERTATLKRFRDGELRLLVASDVAARGLDIPDVSHVFNYDPPNSPEDYVHRIGRTGRAGKKGASITIAGPEDMKKLKAIEDMLGGPIPPLDLKGGKAAAPEAGDTQAEAGPGDADTDIGAQTGADADAAPEAGADGEAREPREGRGRRRGRRGRSRGGKPETAGEANAAADADAPPKNAEQKQAAPKRAEPKQARPEPEPELDDYDVDYGIEEAAPEDVEDIAGEPQLLRSGAHAPQRRGGGPVGFGDHVPAFVTRSVRERLVEAEI